MSFYFKWFCCKKLTEKRFLVSCLSLLTALPYSAEPRHFKVNALVHPLPAESRVLARQSLRRDHVPSPARLRIKQAAEPNPRLSHRGDDDGDERERRYVFYIESLCYSNCACAIGRQRNGGGAAPAPPVPCSAGLRRGKNTADSQSYTCKSEATTHTATPLVATTISSSGRAESFPVELPRQLRSRPREPTQLQECSAGCEHGKRGRSIKKSWKKCWM